MSENRKASCEKGEVEYILTRKNVKNVNLRVRSDGTVCVSASKNVPIKFIEDFISSHYDFIVKAVESVHSKKGSETTPEPTAEEFYKNGSRVNYLGELYTLKIVQGKDDKITLCGDEMVLETYDTENLQYVQKLLKNWYYNRIMELYKRLNSEVCEDFSKRYKVPKAMITVKTMRSRWGSCSPRKGKISMNSRLICYPEMAVRSVFVHEYAHFVVFDHSAEFYKVVTEIMPDYREWQKYLR